jgi:hypothetical protein
MPPALVIRVTLLAVTLKPATIGSAQTRQCIRRSKSLAAGWVEEVGGNACWLSSAVAEGGKASSG